MKLYFGSLENNHEDDCVGNVVQCLGYSLFFTSNHVVVCDTKPSSRTVSVLQNSVWPLSCLLSIEGFLLFLLSFF